MLKFNLVYIICHEVGILRCWTLKRNKLKLCCTFTHHEIQRVPTAAMRHTHPSRTRRVRTQNAHWQTDRRNSDIPHLHSYVTLTCYILIFSIKANKAKIHTRYTVAGKGYNGDNKKCLKWKLFNVRCHIHRYNIGWMVEHSSRGDVFGNHCWLYVLCRKISFVTFPQ